MSDILWINGRISRTDRKVLPVEDRGFQFGDAIYEVLKFVDRRPLLVREHFLRLVSGLEALDIASPWDEESFARMIAKILAKTEFDAGIIYVQVTRGVAERVHHYPHDVRPTALAYSRRYTFPDTAARRKGIAVITHPDIRWKYCHLKTVNLLGAVIAKEEARRQGAAEAFLLADGKVTEGAASTVFAVRSGRLITAPLSDAILPGTVRDQVISIALRNRIRVDERPITENELWSVDEAFICSTTQGVMPVVRIDGRPVGEGKRGEVTQRIQKLYDELERSLLGD